MSTAAMSAVQLLKLDDGQFDRTIQDMSVKRLMETISVLQKEMSREQENFNCLSTELSSLKKSSGQYKSVSKDMTASQTKLTLLMNRSMKCFTLQGNLQSKAALERKNSFKGTQPAGVQNKKSEPVKSSDQYEKIASAKRTLAEVSDNRTKGDNSSNTDTPNIQVQSMTSRNSFSDLRSKFNGANSQNGGQTNNFNTKSKVSSNIVRSQSSVSADPSKRFSDNVLSTVTPDVNVKSNNANTNNAVNGSKSSVLNSSSKTSSSGQKPSGTSSNIALQGPIANQQNRFLSKSTDNVFNKPSASVANKPDVVQGLRPSKPRPMVVMNVDKQVIDLDSFTDRKNMLGELKNFKKDLKNIDKTHLQPVSSEEENKNVAKETESKHTPAKHGTLFGEIQAAKKPSELKVAKNIAVKEKQNGTHINEYTHNGGSKDEPTKSVVKPGGGDSQTQLFDDLLKDYDDEDSDNASADSPREVTVVTKSKAEGINSGNAVSSEITLVHTRGSTPVTESSEDNLSESSGVSEDEDRFVTEFSFTQPQSKQKTAVPQVSQSKENVRQPEIKIEEQPLATRKVGSSGAGSHGNKPSWSGSQGYQAEFNEDGEELVKQTRVNMMDWDPAKLLAELYKVTMMPDNIQDISHKFIGMEGLMEKLPMNKKKATLLKTWKRRFFKAKDGWLHYYETNSRDRPSDSLQLMGGKVEELGPRVLGVDDGRGKYLMVRVPTDNEYGQWKVALESQTADNVKATYVRPAPASTPHPKKKVVIVDIGSSAIRAGILGERPTLPHVFFPSTAAVNKKTGEIIVGADAFRPDVRRTSSIVYPIRPTNKVDKFNIDMDVMTAVFNKVFTDLGVNPKQYLVMLSTPQNLGDKLMEGLMKILVDRLHVRGACMVQQSLLALYSYNATSGVIVDIGERLEILPIYDGLLIEGGLSRQAYGGAKIQDSLYISLLENRYKFNTPVERWLVRHLCEKMCYVSDNYKDSKEDCDKDPASFTKMVDLHDFSLPEGAQDHVELDYACFKSPEGFFNTDLWEMDYKNIQKQIYAAIQQCPMDARKQMYRSVYLSGGVTTIPGFAARLELELRKLAPPAAIVEVHAAPQRYHAAYVGACAVASMDVFEMSCVSAEEWNKLGVKACKKWGTG